MTLHIALLPHDWTIMNGQAFPNKMFGKYFCILYALLLVVCLCNVIIFEYTLLYNITLLMLLVQYKKKIIRPTLF